MTVKNNTEPAAGKVGKILVVDDSPSIASFIAKTLESAYELRIAHSGEAALDILKTYQPDLVLLDVVMRGIDGYTVCKKIRSEPDLGFIKVIIISSSTALEERLKGYAAGVDDYISKPFESAELLAKVRVFMRLKSVEDRLEEINANLNLQVKQRTEQLLQAAQMAAIGKNTAGIVHNLKNPLQAVMGYAELVGMDHPDNNNIVQLHKAAHQMQEMIASMLTSLHTQNVQETNLIDLNIVLRDQITLMEADLFFKHQIQKDCRLNPIPLYPCVSAHFSQIFGNLMKNAADAMFETAEKRLTVETASDDRRIVIRISDTGVGIDSETISSIFDPFFTTKPLSAEDDRPTGTGLGLASCREMIESYGGAIGVSSVPNEGTTVTIKLPLKSRYAL